METPLTPLEFMRRAAASTPIARRSWMASCG